MGGVSGKLVKKRHWSGNRLSGGPRVLQTCGNVVPTDILDYPIMRLPDQLRLRKKLGPFEGGVEGF